MVNFPVALLKLHDLTEQKQLLKQMLQSSQKDLITASDLLTKLLPKKQPKSILKGGKKKQLCSESSDEAHAPNLSCRMKLRRCVIAILACNRLAKMAGAANVSVMEPAQVHKCIKIIAGHKAS